MKRSRSETGHRSSVSRVLPIDPGLLAKLIAEFAEHREPFVPKTYHGPVAARGSPKSAVTDHQVLQLRKLRDWYGIGVAEIVRITGIPVATVRNITEWKNRVHLDPGPRPSNLIKEPS